MTSEQAAPRTYGGWRRRRPMGLLGLGPAGTLALLGSVVAVLATVTVSPRAAIYVAPPVLAGAALSLARVPGIPLATAVLIRVRWGRGAGRGPAPGARRGGAAPGPGPGDTAGHGGPHPGPLVAGRRP